MMRIQLAWFRWFFPLLLLVPLPAQAKPAQSHRKVATQQVQPVTSWWSEVCVAAVGLMENEHYLRRAVDRDFSRRALERYFELLDPSRLYFLRGDLEEFRERFQDSFALDLKEGNLGAVEVVHRRLRERVREGSETVERLLAEPWDFSKPWTVELTRERAAWPENRGDADRIWREQLGAELLNDILEEVPVEKARERARKRQKEALRSAEEAGQKERCASALLAMARACDAHSDYLTQEELEEEVGELHLTRVGIGVTLDGDASGVRVAGLLPGGPAHRDGRLRINDRIVAVAEGNGPFRDIEGLPLPRALSLLRGEKGSLVKLKVQPARGGDLAQRTVIAIQRDELHSSEGEAYAKIIEQRTETGMVRYGWVVVPGFYGDDGQRAGRRRSSVSADVARLVGRLKAEKVSGILLDLRGNLGGLLEEAVELGGLFLGRVPIALVRSQDGGVESLAPVRIRRALYEGPLVVLVDRGSASASELLGGALQDYRRAVIVGGEQTFGKGSVQTTVQLGEYLRGKSRKPAGGLALTVGKFYRVSGQSTQLQGVQPDIVLPSTYDVPGEGESALVDPLAHDVLEGFTVPQRSLLSAEHLAELRVRSRERVHHSEEFRAIAEERERQRREWKENQISLQEAVRRAQIAESQRRYGERLGRLESLAVKGRFFRLLLEDVGLKRLKGSEADSLASHDPESVAVEAETLAVLADWVRLSKH
ncbi:MAG: Tail-specific protease precursor [Verrucomicrobiota bacterium]|jgi:carboxyl-terminal processing protease